MLGYVSGVATLLLPAAANFGFPFILTVRIIQGAAFSACLPVMGSITSHWSTLKQNGIFIAILSSFLQVQPMVLSIVYRIPHRSPPSSRCQSPVFCAYPTWDGRRYIICMALFHCCCSPCSCFTIETRQMCIQWLAA